MAAVVILFLAPGMSRADTEQDQLVEKARLTVQAFMTDESVKDELRSFSKEAKGLFIVPNCYEEPSCSAAPAAAVC